MEKTNLIECLFQINAVEICVKCRELSNDIFMLNKPPINPNAIETERRELERGPEPTIS